MCDANMKSELHVTDRYKSEARTTRGGGRKMSKVALQSPMVNGGDTNKDSDIVQQPSILTMPVLETQPPTANNSQGDAPAAKSVSTCPPTFELDHMYANCAAEKGVAGVGVGFGVGGASSADGQQMKYMKDLLLLHLDLIQQQQGQLNARDLKIAALRRDNNVLQKRIEEANSRLAAYERVDHQRRRNFQHTKDGSTSFLDFRRQRKSISLSGESRRKRTSSADSLQFKNHSTPSCSRGSFGDTGGSHGQSASKSGGRWKHHQQQQPSSSSSFSHKSLPSKQPQQQQQQQSKETIKESVLLTDIMYYTPVGDALRCADTWSSSVTPDEQVLVPTWRIRPVTSCYQMEGTENLDDDIFLKRHQKLEIDEKRRKRWDIQRLREQRLQEKLKRGRGGCNKETLGNRSPELSTFYPRVEEVEEVEVSEIIPVSAFGYSIPSIETEEFRVPWLS